MLVFSSRELNSCEWIYLNALEQELLHDTRLKKNNFGSEMLYEFAVTIEIATNWPGRHHRLFCQTSRKSDIYGTESIHSRKWIVPIAIIFLLVLYPVFWRPEVLS